MTVPLSGLFRFRRYRSNGPLLRVPEGTHFSGALNARLGVSGSSGPAAWASFSGADIPDPSRRQRAGSPPLGDQVRPERSFFLSAARGGEEGARDDLDAVTHSAQVGFFRLITVCQ